MVATSDRPRNVTLDWKSRILEIIAKYPFVLNKPIKRPRKKLDMSHMTPKVDKDCLSHSNEEDSSDISNSSEGEMDHVPLARAYKYFLNRN